MGVAEEAARDDGPRRDEEVEELRREVERLQAEVGRLARERDRVQDRLDFVEEIVGPTEAQRKIFQDQVSAARAAALQVYRSCNAVPVRFVGRLDEPWLQSMGLSERDCALLQRGCITGSEGVPRDVSLLGDPTFHPYDEKTQAPRWDAVGGLMKLTLGDVRDRWGEEVALEVMRCAMELDKFDASRRLGVELPWHEVEGRELEPAEVVGILEREILQLQRAYRSSGSSSAARLRQALDDYSEPDSEFMHRAHTDAVLSPTWSMLEESGETAFGMGSFNGLDGTTSASPSSSRTSPGGIEPPWAFGLDRFDEWSLADADIEQLLRQPAVAGTSGTRTGNKPGADATVVPMPPAGQPNGGADGADHEAGSSGEGRGDALDAPAEEGFADVLRELLEEEIAGSIGRLLLQSPPSQQPPPSRPDEN